MHFSPLVNFYGNKHKWTEGRKEWWRKLQVKEKKDSHCYNILQQEDLLTHKFSDCQGTLQE